jgi:hypothetical protein
MPPSNQHDLARTYGAKLGSASQTIGRSEQLAQILALTATKKKVKE